MASVYRFNYLNYPLWFLSSCQDSGDVESYETLLVFEILEFPPPHGNKAQLKPVEQYP